MAQVHAVYTHQAGTLTFHCPFAVAVARLTKAIGAGTGLKNVITVKGQLAIREIMDVRTTVSVWRYQMLPVSVSKILERQNVRVCYQNIGSEA